MQMRVDEVGGSPDAIPHWLAIAWTVALHVPLVLRRTRPLVSGVVIGALLCGYRLWEVPEYTVSAITIFVSFVALGRYGERGRDVARALITVGVFVVLGVGLFVQDTPHEYRSLFSSVLVIAIAYNVGFLGAAWLLGDAQRRQAAREHTLAEHGALLVAERDLNARRAVTEERLRIAREVHDVVAHHVSVMGVQAGAARRLVDREPERLGEVLGTIERSARQAVDGLRRVIGLLRRDQEGRDQDDRDSGASLEPLPGVGQIARLVEETRSTGLEVALEVRGEPYELPDSGSLSAYRIVQEALTNTIKHARARRGEVVVHYLDDAVEVIVTNDGVGPRGASSGGHGITGMGERVSMHGGELSVGALEPAGFGVTARFPMGAM